MAMKLQMSAKKPAAAKKERSNTIILQKPPIEISKINSMMGAIVSNSKENSDLKSPMKTLVKQSILSKYASADKDVNFRTMDDLNSKLALAFVVPPKKSPEKPPLKQKKSLLNEPNPEPFDDDGPLTPHSIGLSVNSDVILFQSEMSSEKV